MESNEQNNIPLGDNTESMTTNLDNETDNQDCLSEAEFNAYDLHDKHDATTS